MSVSMSRASSPPDRDGGFALVMVLFMVMLLTLLIFRIIDHAESFLRESEIFHDNTQAYYLARSGIEAGKLELIASSLAAAKSGQNFTALNQPWATPMINYPVANNMFLSGIVTDEDSKLNLNQLAANGTPDLHRVGQLEKLFTLLGLPIAVIPAIEVWVSGTGSSQPPPAGAYASQIPPYRPHGAPMDVLSELHQVMGMTESQYQALEPYVTAESDGVVNLNTATEPVLESLDPSMTPQIAGAIISARPFTTMQAASQVIPASVMANIQGDITLVSQTFSISAVGITGNTRQAARAYLTINGSQAQYLSFRVGGNRLLGQVESLIESAPSGSQTTSLSTPSP